MCIKTAKGFESDPYCIANCFNDYFTSIAKTQFQKSKPNIIFTNFQTSPYKILCSLLQLVHKKSINASNLLITKNQTKFLKVIFKSVSEVLSNLFNESFSQGIFPDHMKLALVTLVYKGKSTLEVCNYRPVSIMPIFSKELEKLVKKTNWISRKKVKLFMNTSLDFKKINQPLMQFLISTQKLLIPQTKVTLLVVFSLTLQKPLTPFINALQWSAFIEKIMSNNCFENIKFYFVVFQNYNICNLNLTLELCNQSLLLGN